MLLVFINVCKWHHKACLPRGNNEVFAVGVKVHFFGGTAGYQVAEELHRLLAGFAQLHDNGHSDGGLIFRNGDLLDAKAQGSIEDFAFFKEF